MFVRMFIDGRRVRLFVKLLHTCSTPLCIDEICPTSNNNLCKTNRPNGPPNRTKAAANGGTESNTRTHTHTGTDREFIKIIYAIIVFAFGDARVFACVYF